MAGWQKESGRRLGGIPDIVVRAKATGAEPRYAVIDPKLRQRDRLPVEELYKILGYLQNFDVQPPVGMVLIYTTSIDAREPDLFRNGTGGTLMSVALNPAAAGDVIGTAVSEVVKIVLELIDLEAQGTAGAGSRDEDPESNAEGLVEAVRSSMASWGRSHMGEIAPSRERIETLVGTDRWEALADDVQVMLATADLVGHQLDPAADFSGPVIGMCAAVEHLLHEVVVAPVAGSDTNRLRQMRTLGAVLDAIDLACRGKGGALQRDIESHMRELGLDMAATGALLPSWRRMNKAFRVPAAHRQVLTKSDWQQLYRLIMGSDTWFVRTYDVLHPDAP